MFCASLHVEWNVHVICEYILCPGEAGACGSCDVTLWFTTVSQVVCQTFKWSIFFELTSSKQGLLACLAPSWQCFFMYTWHNILSNCMDLWKGLWSYMLCVCLGGHFNHYLTPSNHMSVASSLMEIHYGVFTAIVATVYCFVTAKGLLDSVASSPTLVYRKLLSNIMEWLYT